MLLWFVGFTLLEWVACAVFLAACIGGSMAIGHKRFGLSGLLTLVYFSAIGYLLWPTLKTFAVTYNLPLTIAAAIAIWIIAGLITAIVYWLFYCWQVSENYQLWNDAITREISDAQQRVDEVKAKAPAALQAQTSAGRVRGDRSYTTEEEYVHDHVDSVDRDRVSITYRLSKFNDLRYKIFDFDEDVYGNKQVPSVRKEVTEVLPPQFKHHKDMLIGAGVAWPTTMLWLLLSRVIDRLIERFMSMFKGVFDLISRMAFGRVA